MLYPLLRYNVQPIRPECLFHEDSSKHRRRVSPYDRAHICAECPKWECALKSGGDCPSIPLHRDSRSEEHTSELQSLMRISYAVFCLKKNKHHYHTYTTH